MSSTQEVGDIFGAGKGQAHAMLRSPTVLIVSIGLWGMNIFFYRLFGIQYKYVLMYDVMTMEQNEQHQHQKQQQQETEATTIRMDEEDASGSAASDNENQEENNEKQMTTSLLQPLEITSSAQPQQHTQATSSSLNEHTTSHHASIEWYKLVLFSMALLGLLHAISHYWMEHMDKDVLGAVFWFYLLALLMIFVPLPRTTWLRKACWIVLSRSYELIRPRCHTNYATCGASNNNKTTNNDKSTAVVVIPRAIPFVDVFYADAMCSLSKVFFDWGMLLHMASHYPNPIPPEMHNIIIPSIFAAVPYLIRARQCLVMHEVGCLKKDPKRYQHVANAIKYSTSIFPLVLSAFQKTISPTKAQDLEGLLILLLIINASYALYWDIVMDWGMMQNPTAVMASAAGCAPSVMSAPPTMITPSSKHNKPSPKSFQRRQKQQLSSSSCRQGCLRQKLRFGLVMSVWIVLVDCVLRFSWLLRFAPSTWFPSPDALVLLTQFLEVFRRAIWNLLRVEWENIKQKAKNIKAHDSLSDHEGDDDNYLEDDGDDGDLFLWEEDNDPSSSAMMEDEQGTSSSATLVIGKTHANTTPQKLSKKTTSAKISTA